MRAYLMLLGALAPVAFLAAACSANGGSNLFGNGGGGATAGTSSSSSGKGGSGSSTSSGGQGGDLAFDGGTSGSGGGQPGTCNSGPNEDKDKDGFTVTQGDCNDCDPNVNPNAVDVGPQPTGDGGMTMPTDNNCDMKVTLDVTCDDMLNDVAEPNPMGGAWAVELCKKSTGPKDWGVAEAHWVLPDGSPPPAGFQMQFDLGHGVLTGFGPNVKVQAGKRMLALSSGTARQPTDPGYMAVSGFSKGYTSNSPQGFPKESPACPGSVTGQPHDGAGLELTVRTPSNAHGFSFDFDFFTFEWPGFICSTFNDFFVAILSPIPQGQSDGNISFDSQGNPVSVNNAFLDVCGCAGNPPAACMAGGKTFPCSLGDQALVGTGFGKDAQFGQDHGSTYWLATKAPVQPNTEIILRWGVYDSGDGVLDTTTLIDNWQWIATAGTTVGTGKIPDPK